MSWGRTSPAEVRAGVTGLLLWGLRQKVESVSEGRVCGGVASSHRISVPLSTLSMAACEPERPPRRWCGSSEPSPPWTSLPGLEAGLGVRALFSIQTLQRSAEYPSVLHFQLCPWHLAKSQRTSVEASAPGKRARERGPPGQLCACAARQRDPNLRSPANPGDVCH